MTGMDLDGVGEAVKYPAKKKEFDVHHSNIACDIACYVVYNFVYYIIYNVICDVIHIHLLSCALSGGLFHWKKSLVYSVVDEGLQLYHFLNTKAGKEEPDKSQELEIGVSRMELMSTKATS